jgi:hypothetical protein
MPSMIEQPPVVRGRHLKINVAAVTSRPDGVALVARLPPELLRQVADAGGLDWLPVEHDIAMARILYQAMGAEEADEFYRAQGLATLQGPLLETMVRIATDVLGLDPARLARWLPKGLHMIYRGVGTWSVGEPSQGKDRVRLDALGLPEVCVEDPVWLRAVGQALSAMLVVAGVPGRVELLPRSQSSRDATFEFSWGAATAEGPHRPRG